MTASITYPRRGLGVKPPTALKNQWFEEVNSYGVEYRRSTMS